MNVITPRLSSKSKVSIKINQNDDDGNSQFVLATMKGFDFSKLITQVYFAEFSTSPIQLRIQFIENIECEVAPLLDLLRNISAEISISYLNNDSIIGSWIFFDARIWKLSSSVNYHTKDYVIYDTSWDFKQHKFQK